METPIYIALSRQSGLSRELNTIANNIANASTNGFRGSHKLFQEYLERTGTPGNRDRLSFTQDIGDYRDLSEGKLQQTGNPLDIAIQGKGFFLIGNPADRLFTRTGTFHLDGNRQIVTSDGYPVLQDNGQPITVPNDTQITIAADGTVYSPTLENGVVSSGRTAPLGRIGMVQFADEQRMQDAGSGRFTTDQAPLPATDARMIQGALETSNVQPVLEVTRMLEIMRKYELLGKLIDAENERQRAASTKIVQNR